MSMTSFFRRAVGVSVLSALASVPLSAQSTYFGFDNDGSTLTRASLTNSNLARTQFFSQLSGVGTETFDGFSRGTTSPIGLSFPGAGSATLTGSGCVSDISWSACSNPISNSNGQTNGFGRYAVSGSNYYEVNAGDFRINFTQAVAAFGFYGVDVGELGGTLALRFYNGSTVLDTRPINYQVGEGSAFYFGYINTVNPFTSVEFVLGGSSSDVFAFDDMTIGSREQVSVPEPASAALLLTGLAGFGAVASRRRRSMR
ncbi:PEP-CTERM sorting domain-containing protein [Gemmatimonas sp.]